MHFRSGIVRGTALALGLLVGAGSMAACGKYSISNLRSLKAFKDGTDAYKKSDYPKAAELFEEAVSYNPDQGQGVVYFFLANSYDQMYKPTRKGEAKNDDNIQKAVQYYQTAIEKLQGSTEMDQKYRQLSYEYLIAAYGPEKLNDFAKAEPIAKKMIEAKPDDPAMYQALGKLYADQGRFDEAEEQFKKSVSVKPNDPQVYQALATFYNDRGRFEDSMAALAERTKFEPNNPEAYHYMATFYQDKIRQDFRLSKAKIHEYALAGIAAEDKALSLNPNYADAMIYKNILLRVQANTEKDPALQKRLISEAEELLKHGLEIRQGLNAAAADKKDDKKGGDKKE